MSVDNPIKAAGSGTPLSLWQASSALAQVATVQADELLPPGARLVVVAPHPDDEVLGCGGLLSTFCGREQALLLVSVTDGEGSHPGSLAGPGERLRVQRPLESRAALAALGLDVDRVAWQRLHLADSGVAAHEAQLAHALVRCLRPGDRVLSTWRLDGHCDHEAVGRASAQAAQTVGAQLIEVPIWAWHWARPDDPRLPWRRARKLALSPQQLARKRAAIAAHASQLHADGEQPPVLSQTTLQRLLQPFELLFL
jgi:LmbE family N-acetylglucosaminyl deacetylase